MEVHVGLRSWVHGRDYRRIRSWRCCRLRSRSDIFRLHREFLSLTPGVDSRFLGQSSPIPEAERKQCIQYNKVGKQIEVRGRESSHRAAKFCTWLPCATQPSRGGQVSVILSVKQHRIHTSIPRSIHEQTCYAVLTDIEELLTTTPTFRTVRYYWPRLWSIFFFTILKPMNHIAHDESDREAITNVRRKK